MTVMDCHLYCSLYYSVFLFKYLWKTQLFIEKYYLLSKDRCGRVCAPIMLHVLHWKRPNLYWKTMLIFQSPKSPRSPRSPKSLLPSMTANLNEDALDPWNASSSRSAEDVYANTNQYSPDLQRLLASKKLNGQHVSNQRHCLIFWFSV